MLSLSSKHCAPEPEITPEPQRGLEVTSTNQGSGLYMGRRVWTLYKLPGLYLAIPVDLNQPNHICSNPDLETAVLEKLQSRDDVPVTCSRLQ